jgi:dolichol-phosphate mannosyltransferase
MHKNIIVIPTYNEKDNIIILLKKIFSLLPEISVMVVDDNSPDKTWEAVENLKSKYPRLSLLKRGSKEGLDKSYSAGFKKVLENPDWEIVIMMDADLSHDPKYLPEMLKLAEKFDLVVGSRYIPGGGITKKWEVWRRFLSAAGNLYLRIIFWRYPIHDWTTGYNVIKTNTLRKINFDLLNPKGYAFISSLKYYLAKSGATIKESPIFFEERNGGESKMSSGIILEGLATPWKILLREIFYHP